MKPFVLTVDRHDAQDVRTILRRHLGSVWFTERPRWWWWVRFTVTGSSAAIAAVRRDLEQAGEEAAIQNAW